MEKQPKEDAEQRPGFFKSANGVIAGLTGLVVAVGGLVTAYREFIQKPRMEAAANAESANAEQGAETEADTSTADAQSAEDEDPWSYTINTGGSLRFQGGIWIETDAEGNEARYWQESVENGFTYASNNGAGPKGEDVFLRWQTAGGQAEKSFDRQKTWNDVYKVTPETPQTADKEDSTQ